MRAPSTNGRVRRGYQGCHSHLIHTAGCGQTARAAPRCAASRRRSPRPRSSPSTSRPASPAPTCEPDFRCGIHDRLRERGFAGCASYDCFGAGQQVVQVTFGGRNWRDEPSSPRRMFATFSIMRQLHELLWYIGEALTLDAAGPVHDELAAALRRDRATDRRQPRRARRAGPAGAPAAGQRPAAAGQRAGAGGRWRRPQRSRPGRGRPARCAARRREPARDLPWSGPTSPAPTCEGPT